MILGVAAVTWNFSAKREVRYPFKLHRGVMADGDSVSNNGADKADSITEGKSARVRQIEWELTIKWSPQAKELGVREGYE